MKAIISILFCFTITSIYSQSIKISGTIKQPKNEKVTAYIVVNDTLNKLSKLDNTKLLRKKIHEEKKLFTLSDNEGKFTIHATKPNDTVFFKFGRFFHDQKHSVKDLLKKNKIKLSPKPIPCISEPKCDQKKPSKIYAFVGKKLNVEYVDTSKYCITPMDLKFNASYEILQSFSDHYPKKNIKFTAYDHSSKPQYFFSNYDNILIFVGEVCNNLYYMKYEFYPVYKTTNGKWATTIDKNRDYYNNMDLAPQAINFEQDLSFDVPEVWTEQTTESKFPKEYYKVIGRKAFPIKGIYVEDLAKFKLNKIKDEYKL